MTDLEKGLSTAQVQAARRQYGSNFLSMQRTSVWRIFWSQLNSPLLAILTVTTVVAYFFDDRVNAAIIFGIMTVSVGLGFFNEYSSHRTVSDLLKRVSLSALVIRDGEKQDLPVGEVVVGDLVLLHQGTVVPADLKIVKAQGLAIDEANLTGESLPVYKHQGDKAASQALMGTVVSAGSGVGIVTSVAKATEFGRLSQKISGYHGKTAFQKGLTELTTLTTKVIVVMALVICFLNIGLGKKPLDAVMFSLAVAIGLTPALLPVIVTVGMARGAHRLARHKVIIKRLLSIEDLGNMEVLCTDKTGTLTEGKISLTDYANLAGWADPYVLDAGLICNTAAVHHKVVGNPIDAAIWEYAQAHRHKLADVKKIAEKEFDFEQRGQLVVIEREQSEKAVERLLIFKGAPDAVLDRCKTYRNDKGHLLPISEVKQSFRERFHRLNQQGLRLIAVAQKPIEKQGNYDFSDANDLQLLGYLTFLDVPKKSAITALDSLQNLGVEVKILTGDNELVARKICAEIGFKIRGVLTGPALDRLSDSELRTEVAHANVFARISPEQKEQVITVLRKSGKVVGFMGDGVNDAPALKAADVGISVNTAVDVAKDLASVVLLQKGLDVIADGIREGRRIFANTIKYILMGTSSNFGNMFSVAGISFILPFLPMTPSQILLNNCLYDLSQLGLPGDEVDAEELVRPHRWNIRYINRYMLYFGPVSSFFDYASFAILWFIFQAAPAQFQTGWFLESIFTQVLVVFIIRTQRKPFYKSRPGKQLIWLCGLALGIAFLIPLTPAASYLRFQPLPPLFYLTLLILIVFYLLIVEYVKTHFLEKVRLRSLN